jgi:hypothetical protein
LKVDTPHGVLMAAPVDPREPASTSYAKQTRSFLRAFAATNYLLGKRGSALSAGIELEDGWAREVLGEVTAQLSHGLVASRARTLAAEVGRLLRSLGAQKLK